MAHSFLEACLVVAALVMVACGSERVAPQVAAGSWHSAIGMPWFFLHLDADLRMTLTRAQTMGEGVQSETYTCRVDVSGQLVCTRDALAPDADGINFARRVAIATLARVPEPSAVMLRLFGEEGEEVLTKYMIPD